MDLKLGGTQCNIIMNRLKPWLRLHSSKNKKMVLRKETSSEKPQSSEPKATIMWTFTMSAPEMTIVLYSISGSPLYHVSNVLLSIIFLLYWKYQGVYSGP